MARPRSPDSNRGRAVGESKQRQVEFQPQHVRRFEILKSTPLGLVYPQNLRLEVIDLGDSKDLTSAAPLFTTSELKWWKVKMMLPPSFEIYSPHQDHLHDAHPSPSEINGLPGNKPLGHDKPYPVAQIRYPGWEGMSHLHVDITLYNFTPEMHFDPTLHSLDDNSDIRSHWTVKRVGCKREYSLSCTSSPGTHTSYTWRSRAKSEILTLPDVDDGHAAANGNLCLETPAGEIVAVYKQRRDYRVLGALTVFQDTLDSARKYSSNQDANTGNVHPSIEAIVASCLALVLYERIGGQSLFGS